MATRVVNRKYQTITEFLNQWENEIKNRSLFLPAGTAPEDLTAEFKLDLILPTGTRLGPFSCQVVHRGGDGSIGAQIPEIGPDLQSAVDGFCDARRDSRLVRPERRSRSCLRTARRGRSPRRAGSRALKADQAASAGLASGSQPAPAGAPTPVDSGPRPRGLQLPDLSGLEPIAKGTLGNTTFRDLLVELAVQNVTGLLTLVTPDGTKRYGFWQKGGPVGWRSDPIIPEETLGMLLYKAEYITKAQLAESLQMMEANNTRQGEALIEMSLLTFGQLVSVLERQVEFVLQNVLAEEEGVWVFHTVDSFAERFVNPPVRVPSMLYKGLRITPERCLASS